MTPLRNLHSARLRLVAGVLAPAALLVLNPTVAASASRTQTASANAHALAAPAVDRDVLAQVRRADAVPYGAKLATLSAAAFYDAYQGLTPAEIEVFLREAEVIAARPIGIGVTKPWRVTLDDGVLRHDAAVQFVDACESLPAEDHSGATACDSYKYNVAAYEIGKLLEVRSIPPSVERRYAGQPSAFTWWIDDSETLAELEVTGLWQPTHPAWTRQQALVVIFDELIHNTDRHQANLLQDPIWFVWMIDHSRAFRPVKGLLNSDRLRRMQMDPQLLARLRELSATALERCCKAYITPEERESVLARRDSIVAMVGPR